MGTLSAMAAKSPKATLTERLAGVELVAFDVDGTLTDGSIGYVGDEELQLFHVHDGYGVAQLVHAGIQVVWISGRGCRATVRRAHELGVQQLVRKVGPKDLELAEIQAELGIEPAATAAMGDDLPDLAFAKRASVLACPADAVEGLRERADWVSRFPGGRGAAREFCDLLLAARRDAPSRP